MGASFVRICAIVICTFVAVWSASAQQYQVKVKMLRSSARPNEIVYNNGTSLRLTDFEGDYEPGMNAIAMAYSGVSLQYKAYTKGAITFIEIELYPSFDKSRSWCLAEHRNEYTLEHEQRHFDITVLSACALYRALQEFSFTKNFQQEILRLKEEYMRQSEAEQERYDKATNHGINKDIQALWNEKIKKALAETSDCYR